MDSWYISAGTFACVFLSGVAGWLLQTAISSARLAPVQDTFKLTAGVVATLSALVIGLLIASTKTSYDMKLNNVRGLVTDVTLMDRSMRHYHPLSNSRDNSSVDSFGPC